MFTVPLDVVGVSQIFNHAGQKLQCLSEAPSLTTLGARTWFTSIQTIDIVFFVEASIAKSEEITTSFGRASMLDNPILLRRGTIDNVFNFTCHRISCVNF